MGMFDSFNVNIKCPWCGEKNVIEFQTKALMNMLAVWNEGDKFDCDDIYVKEGKIMNCLGGCNSKKCTTNQRKKDGFVGGFRRQIYCDILIKNNKIIGGVNVRRG